MEFETDSERLFSRVCSSLGYLAEKIPLDNSIGAKVPDFRVLSNGRVLFVAEVKELQANPSDRQEYRDLQEKGWGSNGGIVGSRAREAVKTASKQLKKVREKIPRMVVLFNNIKVDGKRVGWDMQYLGPTEIGVALYGDLLITVTLNGPPSKKPPKTGGNRTLEDCRRTYISAVAVVNDQLDLIVYHNQYASLPLNPRKLEGEKVHHLIRNPYSEDPTDWVPYSEVN